MKAWHWITAGFFLAGRLLAGTALDSFEARRDFIIGQVVADPQAAITDHPFFVAQACFLAGKTEEEREIARKGYLSWSSKDSLKVCASGCDSPSTTSRDTRSPARWKIQLVRGCFLRVVREISKVMVW